MDPLGGYPFCTPISFSILFIIYFVVIFYLELNILVIHSLTNKSQAKPARATIEAKLADPNYKIEVIVTAAV